MPDFVGKPLLSSDPKLSYYASPLINPDVHQAAGVSVACVHPAGRYSIGMIPPSSVGRGCAATSDAISTYPSLFTHDVRSSAEALESYNYLKAISDQLVNHRPLSHEARQYINIHVLGSMIQGLLSAGFDHQFVLSYLHNRGPETLRLHDPGEILVEEKAAMPLLYHLKAYLSEARFHLDKAATEFDIHHWQTECRRLGEWYRTHQARAQAAASRTINPVASGYILSPLASASQEQRLLHSDHHVEHPINGLLMHPALHPHFSALRELAPDPEKLKAAQSHCKTCMDSPLTKTSSILSLSRDVVIWTGERIIDARSDLLAYGHEARPIDHLYLALCQILHGKSGKLSEVNRTLLQSFYAAFFAEAEYLAKYHTGHVDTPYGPVQQAFTHLQQVLVSYHGMPLIPAQERVVKQPADPKEAAREAFVGKFPASSTSSGRR